jgi:cytochrome c-type protein NapB
MKKSPFLILGLLLGLSFASWAADVQSLRGAMDIVDPSAPVDIKKVQPDRDPIPRDYVQQPPLIPHKIDNYKITLKYNKCLTCHSWKNYKRYKATKISQTHFEDRDANVLANISARRYFCTQCHVPQVDAQPLVENEFKPVEALR